MLSNTREQFDLNRTEFTESFQECRFKGLLVPI